MLDGSTQRFVWIWPEFNRSDGVGWSNYTPGVICLPEGAVWEVTRFGVMADTTHAAADTNYQTFRLRDSSFNILGVVANGSSTTGSDIGPTEAGITTTISSTCGKIDARTAAKYIMVDTLATGYGIAMTGVSGFVDAKAIGH